MRLWLLQDGLPEQELPLADELTFGADLAIEFEALEELHIVLGQLRPVPILHRPARPTDTGTMRSRDARD